MAHDTVRPRWRPRVPLEPIRRLYQADAIGLPDDELAGKVGYALYERCLSMIQASKAVGGEVCCPGCRTTIVHDRGDETILACAQCGWRMPWKDYYKTIRKKKLAAPGILPVLQAYAEAFPGCRSYREKMVEIDRLIHTFHAQSLQVAYLAHSQERAGWQHRGDRCWATIRIPCQRQLKLPGF